MKELGLSLYPKDIKQDKEYLELGIKYGIKILFISLLNQNQMTNHMNMIKYAKSLGYKIMVDINNELDFSYQELLDQGVELFRIDGGDIEIPIENKVINASINNTFIHTKYACHNFYPLKYTGLSNQYFYDLNKKYKKHFLKIMAFVSSNAENAIGPWPINEGICTLEAHRDLPIDVQVKHLLRLDTDIIIIGNAYADESELKACQDALMNLNTIHIECLENSIIEDKIINEYHYLREEKNDYVLRSTNTRLNYKKYPIFQKNVERLYKGDVVIINDTIEHYKGELHILLKNIKNDGRYNLVGRIPKVEHILLEEKIQELQFVRKE